MKKFFKKALCLVMCGIMLAACAGLTACEDIKTLEVKFTADEAGTEYTLTVDLYRHLAPKTCAVIEKRVAEGFYDGTYIYKNDSYSKQIMLGDLKSVDGKVTVVKSTETVTGEFEKGGTTGSNLLAKKGYVGLWRDWNASDNDGNKYEATNGMDSGSATWFLPTEAITDYDGYFCIFAVIDMDDAANSSAFDAMTGIFDDSDCKEYVVYYTGEYDATKDNCGLTSHCVLESDFNKLSEEEKESVFEAEKDQSVAFNKRTVKLSENAKIVSVKVK